MPTSIVGDTGVSLVQSTATPFLVGQVSFFGMTTAPAGWLKCNGALVSRATYASLFTAIGTTYGAGDGSTTFALPDLRGEFLRALDDGRGVDTGRVFGSAQVGTRFPSLYAYALNSTTGTLVSHPISSNTSYPNNKTVQDADSMQNGTSSAYMTVALSPGGASTTIDFTSRPRNVALLACIKF
jgi:microcystin-dependent protein